MSGYDYEANKDKMVDSTGRRLSSGLFKELSGDPNAPFEARAWRKTYVQLSDPTEYKAAMELIGDWEHWKFLRANPVVAKMLDDWKQEVATKLKSEAIKNMKDLAKTEKGAAAARWLAEGSFETRKVGRPRKDKEVEESSGRPTADAKRLGITVVK